MSVTDDMAEDLAAADAEVIINDLPVIQAVESLIRQVLQNLIDNSLKYGSFRRPPLVEITAEAEPPGIGHERPMWCITVQDNGIGIDPSQADQVFSMFTRLEVSNDRPGTGVGLAFVKRVVEQHGGNVGLAPPQAEGTGIWFTLPGIDTPDAL
jgi:signal transduction histidine kinase